MVAVSALRSLRHYRLVSPVWKLQDRLCDWSCPNPVSTHDSFDFFIDIGKLVCELLKTVSKYRVIGYKYHVFRSFRASRATTWRRFRFFRANMHTYTLYLLKYNENFVHKQLCDALHFE